MKEETISEYSISRLKWNNWFVISITGRFTVQNLVPVRSVFEDADRSGERLIAINFSTTTYLDSSAITILLNFHKRCTEKGGKLVLFGLNPDIEGIVSIIGIDKILPIVKTINELPS